jgi:hypothetical protein
MARSPPRETVSDQPLGPTTSSEAASATTQHCKHHDQISGNAGETQSVMIMDSLICGGCEKPTANSRVRRRGGGGRPTEGGKVAR